MVKFGRGPELAVILGASHEIRRDIWKFTPQARVCGKCGSSISEDETIHLFKCQSIAKHPQMMIGTSTPNGEYYYPQHALRLCDLCCPVCDQFETMECALADHLNEDGGVF